MVLYFYRYELFTNTWLKSIVLSFIVILKTIETITIFKDSVFIVIVYNNRLRKEQYDIFGNLSRNYYKLLNLSMNVLDPLTHKCKYNVGIYQNYNPNYFDLNFKDYNDKTEIYRLDITKRSGKNKGKNKCFV